MLILFSPYVRNRSLVSCFSKRFFSYGNHSSMMFSKKDSFRYFHESYAIFSALRDPKPSPENIDTNTDESLQNSTFISNEEADNVVNKSNIKDSNDKNFVSEIPKSLLFAEDKKDVTPKIDIVFEYSKKSLETEGRSDQVEARIWEWNSTAPPILARGKRNYFDFMDDIPSHVTPFWDHEYYQQREFFRSQRSSRSFKELWKWFLGIVLLSGVLGAALVIFRIWVAQPLDLRAMREELLQQTYGTVLELAAGQGQNIGAYPYAVHSIVMTDSSSAQLDTLRYRLPKTAYPSYRIQQLQSDSLYEFEDASFDCVVDFFGLCHLRDPLTALRQMQRVVKPNGLILLLEHGKSSYPPINWILNFFSERHKFNTHGCQWNLPIGEYLEQSRLEIKELRKKHYGTTFYVVAYPEQLDFSKEVLNSCV